MSSRDSARGFRRAVPRAHVTWPLPTRGRPVIRRRKCAGKTPLPICDELVSIPCSNRRTAHRNVITVRNAHGKGNPMESKTDIARRVSDAMIVEYVMNQGGDDTDDRETNVVDIIANLLLSLDGADDASRVLASVVSHYAHDRHADYAVWPLVSLTTVLPNGHTVSMIPEVTRDPNAFSDDHHDAGWSVVLDTSAARLDGHEPGVYTPHDGA